jgi:hypothetical protein
MGMKFYINKYVSTYRYIHTNIYYKIYMCKVLACSTNTHLIIVVLLFSCKIFFLCSLLKEEMLFSLLSIAS